MEAPSLAARLRAGETLISAWSTLPEPLVAEAIARQGFDCVTLDMQHGLHDTRSVSHGIGGVALAGKAAIVRIPVGDNAFASRALDMGAQAIIAPMINTAAEARALVAATKYPPVGERSWGPARALQFSGNNPQVHLETSNAGTLALAMTETSRAVAALDEILAVAGLDGIFVGPSDLSVTLSDGRKIAPFDADLDVTLRRIADAANAAGKIAGAFAATSERARHFRSLGYRLLALGSDSAYLAAGVKVMLDALK
ncbi:MAG: aldolase/citrate lyase family protein [Bauldia sp.]